MKMFWVALLPSPDDDRIAWGWRALQFSPRVAFVDEALLLEVEASERLFGGRKRLLKRLLKCPAPLSLAHWAQAATAHAALGLLRGLARGEAPPEHLPEGLALEHLSAARPHLGVLSRIGCSTWGQLRALPRAGLNRRFGPALLQALDAAWGERPERFDWITLPAAFDQKLELPMLATSAPELLWGTHRLLLQLQQWLQGRNLGMLAVELEWKLDLRRLDGRLLPSHEHIELRTAQPTQDIRHLVRLASEQLARTPLAAPANELRLRTLETVPWGGVPTSLLPEDVVKGERLHQLVERLSIRLGEGNVLVPETAADHRPEHMQHWRSARRGAGRVPPEAAADDDALLPPWLLRQPLRLQVKGEKPCYQGPLQLLTRARRVEGAWWDPSATEPVLRDYFVARSESAGLLWVYRERLHAGQDEPQWFLQGLYA